MTKEQQYFLHLVSSHLNNTTPEAPIDIDLSELFEVCELQNMTALAAIELKKLVKTGVISKEQFSPFNQVLGLTIQNYEYKSEGIALLDKVLCDNNINHLFIKGPAIRKYYPVPEVRTSGDTDVVVNSTDFDAATKLLIENGFKLIHSSENENVLIYNDEQFEIKNRIEYINNKTKEFFSDSFDESKCCIENKYTYELAPIYHLVYITYHAIKHLRGCGVGVRQIADIDLMLRNANVDINSYLDICTELGFEKCAKALVAMAKNWFNTPVSFDYEISPQLEKSLSEIIINGGPFGFENNLGTSRLYRTIAKTGKADKSASIKALLELLKANKTTLYGAYEYSNKHHYLLPIAYFNRLFDAVFKRGRQNIGNIKSIINDREFAESIGEMLSELE